MIGAGRAGSALVDEYPARKDGKMDGTGRGAIGGVLLTLLVVVGLWQWGREPGGDVTRLSKFDGVIKRRDSTYDPVMSDLYVRASQALEAGDAPAAEALYREAISKYPQDSDGYTSLGACLYFQKRYEAAITEYGQALRIDPRSARAFYGLGCVAYEQERLTEARDYLEKALAIDEKDGGCHRMLGFVYDDLGDVAKAKAHFERGAALEPKIAADQDVKRRLDELRSGKP